MTDRVLLPAAFGGQVPVDDVAVVPGWGPIPGADARAHVTDLLDHGSDTDGAAAFVWLRRLFTDPTSRDLLTMDSRRRRFHGGLRRFLELRDPTCRIPWCDAPGVESDHAQPVHDHGSTDAANGDRMCKRHNQVKELPGWHVRAQSTGLDGTGPHGIRITTPTGQTHDATAPPILGEGWPAPEPDDWHDWDDWHHSIIDTELHEMPLPDDPWGSWIPDPPPDWFLQHEQTQVA